MQGVSLKRKLTKALTPHFTKSTQSPSRVKGLSNITAGFDFTKYWDNYYLYYRNGNMVFRGMPLEEQNNKTRKMYDWLVANGFQEYIEYEKGNDRLDMIKLIHE